jgi:hypothetical protein
LTDLTSVSPLVKAQGVHIRNDKMNYLVKESIDEALVNLIGRRARDAIYDHLERVYSVDRESIPGNLQTFFELLQATFGKGSITIGRAIVRKLFEKLEWKFNEVPCFGFFDYLEAIRTRMERERGLLKT